MDIEAIITQAQPIIDIIQLVLNSFSPILLIFFKIYSSKKNNLDVNVVELLEQIKNKEYPVIDIDLSKFDAMYKAQGEQNAKLAEMLEMAFANTNIDPEIKEKLMGLKNAVVYGDAAGTIANLQADIEKYKALYEQLLNTAVPQPEESIEPPEEKKTKRVRK